MSNRTIILRCLLLSCLCIFLLSSIVFAANIESVDPAYPIVVNGSTFKVRVKVVGAQSTGSHCVTVELKATGGFSPAYASKYISHLSSGSAQTLEFTLTAPSSDSSGLVNVSTKWSNVYSCRGTYLSSQRSFTIACNSGWKLSVYILKPGGALTDKPTYWTVSNSWRYSSTKQSNTSPYYYVTFTVPAMAANYTIRGTWWIYLPLYPNPVPRGATKTVYISKSGTEVALP